MSAIDHEGRLTLLGSSTPDTRREFVDDVRRGLTSDPKRLPCRWLYDARGSQLFERICELPEYYPTRAEASILARIAPEIAASFETAPRLVELGSGSAEKTRHLIEALLERFGELCFEPIDVSRPALEASAQELLAAYPRLSVRAAAAEYVEGLHLLAGAEGRDDRPRLVAWLGSSIGNFHRPDAATFLERLGEELRPGDALLLGVDLRKEPAVLEAAYDDAAGVTAEFIRNLLVRIDRELDGDLDAEAFRYEARYEAEPGRVVMELVNREPRRVRVGAAGLELELGRGEPIHIENSYKYDEDEIRGLAERAGLVIEGRWEDPQGHFCEVLLRRS